MFKYFKLGFNNTVIIYDDDFTEKVFVKSYMPTTPRVINAIINIYYQKQLPIVPNIILFIQYFNKIANVCIEYIMEDFDYYLPEYKFYYIETQKFLVFS